MSLVTEDGTGKSNADAYVTLAECDAYHTNLGNSDWLIDAEDAANVAGRENAIKKATAFIDARYGGRFKGVRSTAEQALLFPRYGISDYSSGAPAGTKFEMIESILRGCLNGGASVRMVRA